MKTTANVAPNAFKPVNLTITLESQAELDFWGSFFNNTYIDAVHREWTGTGLGNVYHELEGLGAEIHQAAKLTSMMKKRFA